MLIGEKVEFLLLSGAKVRPPLRLFFLFCLLTWPAASV